MSPGIGHNQERFEVDDRSARSEVAPNPFLSHGDLDSLCSGLCEVVFDGIEHKSCSASFERETIASDEALIETFKGLDVVPTARLSLPGGEDKSPESLQAAERTHSGASELPVVSFGSRNAWAPSNLQEKKLCGMRRRVFSILLGILCALIIEAAIAGGVTGGMLSEKTSNRQVLTLPFRIETCLTCHSTISAMGSSSVGRSSAGRSRVDRLRLVSSLAGTRLHP
jgi:hypothetical protein